MMHSRISPLSSSQTGGAAYFVALSTLALWSLLMLYLAWEQGIRHDYPKYLEQWRLLLRGEDPWSGTEAKNTYGPLHTLIGYLLPAGQLAPKFFMVGALLVANAALALSLLRERETSPLLIVYLLAVPTNILVVGIGVAYGLNDALVAALLVAGVLLRLRGQFVATGIAIGLAALIKYYPILLLPFFALDGRRLHWSVLASGLAVFCVGMAAASALWGDGLLEKVGYGVSRKPKLLSILVPLRKFLGPKVVWFLNYNAYFVVAGVAATFVLTWRSGRNWLEATVLGYLVMLTLYKVGHQQFYLPWLFMVAALPLVNERSADRMAIIFLPAVLLLSLFHFGYDFASDEYHRELGWVRHYGGGLIAFVVASASIAACVFDYHRGTWRPARPATNST